MNLTHQHKIYEALQRFDAIANDAPCECDERFGLTCPVHRDRILAACALADYEIMLEDRP